MTDDLEVVQKGTLNKMLAMQIRIEKLEDELHHCFHRINELQTALRMVVDWDNTLDWEDGPAWGDLMDIARAALEGKDD